MANPFKLNAGTQNTGTAPAGQFVPPAPPPQQTPPPQTPFSFPPIMTGGNQQQQQGTGNQTPKVTIQAPLNQMPTGKPGAAPGTAAPPAAPPAGAPPAGAPPAGAAPQGGFMGMSAGSQGTGINATGNDGSDPRPGAGTNSVVYTPRKEYTTREGTKYRSVDMGSGEGDPNGWGLQKWNPQTNQWEDAASTQFGNGNFQNFQQFHGAVGNADFTTDAGVQAWMDRMNALSNARAGQRGLYTTGEGNQYRTYNMQGSNGWGMERWNPATGRWEVAAEQAFGGNNPFADFNAFHGAIGDADFSTNAGVESWLQKLAAARSVLGSQGGTDPTNPTPDERDDNGRNDMLASARGVNRPKFGSGLFSSDPARVFGGTKIRR